MSKTICRCISEHFNDINDYYTRDNFFLLQALLRGALTQQSAVILVCMAVDRYTCALYPHKYHQHSSKKVSLFFIEMRKLSKQEIETF